MNAENLKESWLTRETQFSAFTNGSLLDFWNQREEDQFLGIDNIPIRYVRFINSSHNKAIVISPGRSESYIKYPEVAYDFFHLGYDIFIIDHRGQGRSGRMLADPQKGHVEKFSDYIDDFQTFIELEVKCRHYLKCFAVAHSMGGAILSGYLLRDSMTFDAAALCAPMIGINLPLPSWLANFIVERAEPRWAIRNDYAVSTGKWQPLPYLINVLTHSYERYRRYLRYYADYPELRLGGPTYHWIRESFSIGKQLIAKAGEIDLPLMVLLASEDKVVSNRELMAFCDARRAAQTGRDEKLPLVIEGAHHEILFESDALRAMALNSICDFFDQF
ncbi:lysophospholipase L2 [Moellerella wisconsensis]|uniref:Lysophospholipase n=1 Tax=Moellerella wisconsensis ATCC 35017 TaxID=1354267 RepID=A0A0N1KJA7_9GAMM|nr:lysophospholipase L2 [Moellerella wisconsensis]KPD04286.1 lysophospholipase [Moellerella wisconsensis ATCC 35017]VFS52105.1 lysophospholipase L2 [Moellerella wisconsensis]